MYDCSVYRDHPIGRFAVFFLARQLAPHHPRVKAHGRFTPPRVRAETPLAVLLTIPSRRLDPHLRRNQDQASVQEDDFVSVMEVDDGAESLLSGRSGRSGRSDQTGVTDFRSVSGSILPDPATAASAIMAQIDDDGRSSAFDSVLEHGLLSEPSPSVAGDEQSVAETSEYQSALGAPSSRGKTVNEGIAERVLARVGSSVDEVAERISAIREEADQERDGDGDDGGEKLAPLDRLRRAAKVVQGTVKMDFGTDLLRRIPPPPELGTVHSYIAIDRSKSSLYPTYKFYTQAEDSTMDRFVLAARQEPMGFNLKHKRYIFSTDPDNCTVSAAGYWGKLTSNFMGTNFTVFDRGDRRGPRVDLEHERRVLGAIVYEPTTTTGSGGYRKMTALLPTLYKEGEDGMPRLERWEEMRDMRYMHLLTSKVPAYKKFDGQWHYCYKFGGRVKCPSKKNFQMVLDGDQESVVLLFGKVSKNLWTCDFTHPLSAHQAFAIALSSLSSKMCYAF